MIGNTQKVLELYRSFQKARDDSGYRITTFILSDQDTGIDLPEHIVQYNGLRNLCEIVIREQIEELIVAVDKSNRDLIGRILQIFSDKPVNIKITPDTVDIITGTVDTGNVLGVPLIDIHAGLLPSWQQNVKRLIDIVVSILAMILLSPVLLFSIIRQQLSSPGPVFYRQERIGFKGRPFMMYKLRSMYVDAEANGPQLSSDHDPRITPWGKVMRLSLIHI